ncbi:MAG: AraC family transcriptional regulator [Eubacteriales bacterium]|nr:AraC family transcriptional regulator [Eubacteriales bacterium]
MEDRLAKNNSPKQQDKELSKEEQGAAEQPQQKPEAESSDCPIGADERMYHFQEICHLTLQGSFAEALLRMRSQAMFLKQCGVVRYYRVFLNAMNQAHYHYFLNYFDISLHEICFSNGRRLHTVENWADFLRVGEEILQSYAEAAARLRDERNHAVLDAVHYIRENLAADLSLKAVSEYVFLNRSYFSTLFKEVTGQNLTLFVRKERIRQAERYLLGTNYSIEEISNLCGFHSPAYFSTVFKQSTGLSPSEYREPTVL